MPPALPLPTSPTLATMSPRLEDIHCRCLSLSTSAKPTVCTYMESHKLDWYTASSFASEHNLKLHFASQDAITKLLSIPRPLPTVVLEMLGEADVAEAHESGWRQTENRIVCGFGDEVEHLGRGDEGGLEEAQVHFVGYVLAGIMIGVVVYFCVVEGWKRFRATGTIRLEGDEKTLMAASSTAQEQTEENAAPAECS